MVSWEEAFPFAQTDVLDKWKVKTLNAETFNYYIDRTKLAVAGSLSATTTAKLIAYCLLIMEAEHEALQAARVEALRFGRPGAQEKCSFWRIEVLALANGPRAPIGTVGFTRKPAHGRVRI